MINAPLAATLANQSILRNAFRRSSKSILRLSSDPACRPRVERVEHRSERALLSGPIWRPWLRARNAGYAETEMRLQYCFLGCRPEALSRSDIAFRPPSSAYSVEDGSTVGL